MTNIFFSRPSSQLLNMPQSSKCWPRFEHADNIRLKVYNIFKFRERCVIYSTRGNAKKIEIYEETKKNREYREDLQKNFSVFTEKEIPLGYVIKLRNEQQGQLN